MIPVQETLLTYTIEDFIDRKLAAEVLAVVDAHIAAHPPGSFRAGANGRSVHEIRGFSRAQAARVYEPNGRIEIGETLLGVSELMKEPFERNLPRIQRVFPSVLALDCWIYVEYGPGQFVTPHVDYSRNDDRPRRGKVTGIGVPLSDDFEGGEFFVETCGSPALWQEERAELVEGAAWHSDWFRALPRTRWTSRPRLGTAYFYGTRLIHGTNPVKRGRARKLVGFLSA